MKIYEVNFSDEYDVCAVDLEACGLISKVERYDMYFNFDGSSMNTARQIEHWGLTVASYAVQFAAPYSDLDS